MVCGWYVDGMWMVCGLHRRGYLQISTPYAKNDLFIAHHTIRYMQYFVALRRGQKNVESSREYLNKYFDGKAMPALALKSSKGNDWTPVGEENLYAFVDESSGFVLTDNSGYILALVDGEGYSKSIVQGVTQQQKAEMQQRFARDSIREYHGRVTLPV